MTYLKQKLAIAALVLAAGTGVAAAQMAFHHAHRHDGAMGMLRLAGLTDAQKTQADQILATDRAQAKPLWQQLHTLHDAIAARLLAPGSVSAEDLQPLVAQALQLRTALDTQRLSEMLQLRGLLTPDQLTRVASVHAKLAELHAQEQALIETGR